MLAVFLFVFILFSCCGFFCLSFCKKIIWWFVSIYAVSNFNYFSIYCFCLNSVKLTITLPVVAVFMCYKFNMFLFEARIKVVLKNCAALGTVSKLRIWCLCDSSHHLFQINQERLFVISKLL